MNWQTLFLRFKEAVTLSHLLTTANVLLVGSVAWISGDFIATIIENEVLQVPYQRAQFVPPKQQVQDKSRRFSEFNDILEQNIFNAEVTAIKLPLVVEEIEQVVPGRILNDVLNNLKLLGIHYRRNYYIYCIIKHKKKNKEDIFTIGDELFDTGATVHRIFTSFENQRVQIQLENEIGTLEYDVSNLKSEPTKRKKPVKKKTVVKKDDSPSTSSYTTDGSNFYISATEVDSHLNDFGSLLNQARMVPYFKNKKHQGFRVKAIDKGSLYEKLGLKNNDILKAVNGESLVDAGGEKIMGLFKLLRNEREFTIEIQRRGKPQVLNYYVN